MTDPGRGDCLLDTNILLRMARFHDAKYSIISAALEVLRAQKARLCFTSQTLGDFWNASTRPRENRGFGLSTQETDRAARLNRTKSDIPPR